MPGKTLWTSAELYSFVPTLCLAPCFAFKSYYLFCLTCQVSHLRIFFLIRVWEERISIFCPICTAEIPWCYAGWWQGSTLLETVDKENTHCPWQLEFEEALRNRWGIVKLPGLQTNGRKTPGPSISQWSSSLEGLSHRLAQFFEWKIQPGPGGFLFTPVPEFLNCT